MCTFFDGIGPGLLVQRDMILSGTNYEFAQLDVSSTRSPVCKDDRFEDMLKALF